MSTYGQTSKTCSAYDAGMNPFLYHSARAPTPASVTFISSPPLLLPSSFYFSLTHTSSCISDISTGSPGRTTLPSFPEAQGGKQCTAVKYRHERQAKSNIRTRTEREEARGEGSGGDGVVYLDNRSDLKANIPGRCMLKKHPSKHAETYKTAILRKFLFDVQ